MKVDAYDINDKKIKLEVYKVQLAMFGGPGVLIYNEDRTEQWETHEYNEIKSIAEFVQGRLKSYVAGKYNKKTGKIVLMHVLPNEYNF